MKPKSARPLKPWPANMPEADPADTEAEITRYWAPLCMLEMRVDCLTGKQAKELAAGLQR